MLLKTTLNNKGAETIHSKMSIMETFAPLPPSFPQIMLIFVFNWVGRGGGWLDAKFNDSIKWKLEIGKCNFLNADLRKAKAQNFGAKISQIHINFFSISQSYNMRKLQLLLINKCRLWLHVSFYYPKFRQWLRADFFHIIHDHKRRLQINQKKFGLF